jgi:hypothetical protein
MTLHEITDRSIPRLLLFRIEIARRELSHSSVIYDTLAAYPVTGASGVCAVAFVLVPLGVGTIHFCLLSSP